MAVSCPGCGQEVPVTEREVTLLSGACPGCARDVVLWSSTAGSAPTEETSEAAPALSVTHQDGDEDCEGTLSLVVGDKGRLVGTCSDCGSEFVFTLETGAGETEEGEEEERPRPPFRRPARSSGGDRPSFDDREAPRGRPCRKCGGTLRFETGDDGNVTGTCSSCGNTFTLPPRRDDRGGGGGGYRGGGGGGYRGGGGGGYRGGGGGGYRGGGGGGYRGGGGGGGFRGPPRGGGGRPPFRRRSESDGDDDDRPRRRRRE
jgi:hypothetical protein